MCEQCPNATSIQDPNQFNLLSELISTPSGMQGGSNAPQLTCDDCGYTEEKFKKTGRLGCPGCYMTFGQSVEAMIGKMHKAKQHVGKVPIIRQQSSIRRRLVDLETELHTHIQQEDYEAAAQLRDQIANLKKEI